MGPSAGLRFPTSAPGPSGTGALSRRAPAVGPTRRPLLQPEAPPVAASNATRACPVSSRPHALRLRLRAKPTWATRPSRP
eukprot:14053331-Alexandrium_andersonii.AAC.1